MDASAEIVTLGAAVDAGFTNEFSLRDGCETRIEGDDAHVSHPWRTIHIQGPTRSLLSFIEALAGRWASLTGEQEPWASEPGGLAERASLLEALGPLVRRRVCASGEQLLEIEAVRSTAQLDLREAQIVGSRRLSPMAYLRSTSAGALLESPASPFRVALGSERARHALLSLMAAQIEPGDKPRGEEDPVKRELVRVLASADMLERSGPGAAEIIGRLEFHDLLFHQRSRTGLHDGPAGATFPHSTGPPPPAVAPPLSEQAIELARPSAVEVLCRDPLLTHALERRCSGREYGPAPMAVSALAEFLFRCARTRCVYGPIPELALPYEAGDRPHPSGGAAYELELYLAVRRVEGVDRGLFHYAADRHALEPLPRREDDLETVVAGARRAANGAAAPDVVITIGSRCERLSWKYSAIAYATTLKNVGVLYQTMYLVATAMGLSACALGSGDTLAAEHAFGLRERGELCVGDFMIGSAGESPSVSRRTALRAHPTWRSMVSPDWCE